MTQSKSDSLTTSQRDKAIGKLEKYLLHKPDDMAAIRNLLQILDEYLPNKRGLGAYTDCQRRLSTKFQDNTWINDASNPSKMAEHYKQWQAFLDSMCLIPQIPITQSFSGGLLTIQGALTHCGLRTSLFEKEGVISRICHDCFKVQILPLDLTAHMQIYFILRGLKLSRDNTRKCMIDVREDFPYPYKGYIFCESESEANGCLEELQQTLRDLRISNVYCGISHGCSEYGLKYPKFKYSNDGAHRSFERPEFWDQAESAFSSVNQEPTPTRNDHNKKGISIRDVIVFRTWIDYAEIIGDDSCNIFRDTPSTRKSGHFAERVRKQSQLRKTQMEELRQRIYSTRNSKDTILNS